MSEMSENPIPKKRKISRCVTRPDLSAKLERLKRGLKADTVKLTPRINYGQKYGRFGPCDPLGTRSRNFRKAVSIYAPPYYFWHKKFINMTKLKPLVEADDSSAKIPKKLAEDMVWCVWCQQMVRKTDYDSHRTKKCRKRTQYLGNGFYRCFSCKEGFLEDKHLKQHITLHFPAQKLIVKEGVGLIATPSGNQRAISIICRDQAKRKKWL